MCLGQPGNSPFSQFLSFLCISPNHSCSDYPTICGNFLSETLIVVYLG
jgi:hypothetical protein